MDELNSLRKKNGETLDCNEWNKLVSVINYIIEFYNQYPTKLSEFENDINLVSEENIASVIQELVNNGTLSSILGESGADGKSAYLLALENGFVGTVTEWLASLKGLKGSDGKSAFVLAIDNGYTGTLQQWLASLKGQDGTNGTNGKSAYELAVNNGYEGTIQQWLDSLKGQSGINGENGSNGIDGKSAYLSYVDTTSDDPILTEEEWITSLKGQNGTDGINGITPHIDLTTGNWFIGNSDTGVHAQGPAGQDGTIAGQLQADWNQTNDQSVDFIKNKPGVGVANGLATLDSSGKVPSSQLPSYVDDVIEGYYHNSKFYEHYTESIEGGDDAAQAAWGEGWRIPTVTEFQALGDAVNAVWTSDYESSGVAGIICTDKENSSKVLFFPAAGFANSGRMHNVGDSIYYWSSSLRDSDVAYAHRLYFAYGSAYWDSYSWRLFGYPIRPVLASGDSERPYVEIAGIKWSTMNIGAESETDYGLYFQWGDTQGYTASQLGSGEEQKSFDWADYKYCDGTSSVMTKYNSTDGLTTLVAGTKSYSDEITTETSKIYLDIPTNCSYRWSGTAYVLISSPKTLSDWNESNTSSPAYIVNKPTIPDAQIQSDWNLTDSTAKDFIKNKPTIFSGSYNDLTNKPTIPAKISNLQDDSNFLLIPNDQNIFVDMGLPSGTLWATCDIDVTKPNRFCDTPFTYEGSFFSWGNIDGHNPNSGSVFDYNWGSVNNTVDSWYDDQPYGNTTGNNLTDNIIVGEDFDAARANLSAPWRMPTSAEYVELFANIRYINSDGTEINTTNTNKVVSVNGVNGIYIESIINGARLFFSCSGYGSWSGLYSMNMSGYRWSSTYGSSKSAWGINFSNDSVNPHIYDDRFYGFPVRAVLSPSSLKASKVALTGDYNDLINKPVISGGGTVVQSNWNETDTSSPAYILNKPTIINGTNGTNGKSAFELAVDNGFVGTVELWLASLKGLDGQDGLDGSDGLNGTNGTNGTDGITPHIDPVTKHWMIGSTDTNVIAEGKDGTASAAGADGKSAYQSYVDTTSDDPVLTELLWVASLHGADGTNGLNGTNGQDGVTPTIDPTTKHWMLGSTDTGVVAEGQNGSNGTDGITPHIDLITGHWFIGTTDTNIDATGPAGLNGTNGTNGTDGVTPHIDSTTGNWFIGTTDTGVHAQGPSGTSLSNETATQGGSTLSAVTTGEKYTWNLKANIWLGTQAQYDAITTPDPNTIYIITSAS